MKSLNYFAKKRNIDYINAVFLVVHSTIHNVTQF